MRAIEIPRHGGPEVLRLTEKSEPALVDEDSVRVKVKYCGLNFADLMMRMGLYPEAPNPPFVPGYEISGEVIEVGNRVSRLKPGDRVLAPTPFGGYCSEIVLPQISLQKIPENVTDIEAAGIPVVYVTAWLALQEMARVRSGDRVLIHSAAGGVGTAAVQIAKQVGAQVVGLVGQSSKIEPVKELGADEVWLKSDYARMAPGPAGSNFDVILDSSGAKELKRSFEFLNPLGRMVTFGVAGMITGQKRSILGAAKYLAQTPFYTPFQLMNNNKGVYGLNVLKFMEQPEVIASSLAQVLDRFEDGVFKVVVGKQFPLTEAGAAHTYLQSGKNVGKVVLCNSP